MSGEVNDIHIDYEEEGVQVVKELDKKILTKGAWATIMFKYQDWDKNKNEYGPVKYSIRRYQKLSGEYKQRSKFNISSADQAQQIIGILTEWVGTGAKE